MNVNVSSWNVSEAARRLHSDALVWDAHGGFVAYTDLDLSFVDRWLKAGASFLSLNIGFDNVVPWEQTLACAAHYRRWIELHPDTFIQVERASDVRRAKKEGKLAVSFDLEGTDALNGNIDMIGLYYRLGVRQMLFAYNRNNDFGGGCMDPDMPLTALGRQAIDEMNRVGMLVDCSHVGYQSSMEMMERSKDPVIFSHSNPRAVWDNPRNIRDDQMKACAATGGVIGINGVGVFLADNECSAATIVKHIRYAVDLVGIDHVGLGIDSVLDRDEFAKLIQRYPKAMKAWPNHSNEEMRTYVFAQPEQLPQLTEELLKAKFSEKDAMAILGGNFLRVAEKVWK